MWSRSPVSVLAVAAALIGLAGPAASQEQRTPVCDPTLEPSDLQPSYGADADTRGICYGFYRSTVSAPSLQLLSFTANGSLFRTPNSDCVVLSAQAAEGAADEEDCLRLSVASSRIPDHDIRVRGIPRSISLYYRIDARITPQTASIRWPPRGHHEEELTIADLGFFAWFPSDHPFPQYVWPVRIESAPISDREDSAEILLRPSEQLESFFWRWSCTDDELTDVSWHELPLPPSPGEPLQLLIPEYSRRISACSGSAIIEIRAKPRYDDFPIHEKVLIGPGKTD